MVHHQDGSVRLLDLGSSHGTWLDGTRLQPHRGSAAIQDGSRLRFGQCEQTCTAHFGKPPKEEVVRRRGSFEPNEEEAAYLGSLLGGYGSEDSGSSDGNPDIDGQGSDDEGETRFGWERSPEGEPRKRPVSRDSSEERPRKRRRRVSWATGLALASVREIESVAAITRRIEADGDLPSHRHATLTPCPLDTGGNRDSCGA